MGTGRGVGDERDVDEALGEGRAEAERSALITWSAIAEPGDEAASWLVDTLGAAESLAWVHGVRADPVGATLRLASFALPATIDKAVAATERWRPRLAEGDADEALRRAAATGIRIVTRGESEWPECLDDLGPHAPFALWVRGEGRLDALLARSVAVVGSRASTSYGEHVAADIAGGASDAGWCVVSGGAYGIDAAAHRAALTGITPTVAVMAGGVDRLYPAGHADLLSSVMDGGAVFSEVPVGFAPHRSRFLARNRLIAAAAATCVVEAAARSGALSTVNHALRLGRPVGAVPGPVTSASSAGCHALIRDGAAVLVTGARDLVELAGPIGADTDLEEGSWPSEGFGGGAGGGTRDDFGDPDQRAAFDAIASRGSRVEAVAKGSGLSVREAMAALSGLEIAGRARHVEGVWRRVVSGSL